MNLKDVVESFDRMLIERGCEKPEWVLYMLNTQGVGFFPKNDETQKAMSRIGYTNYVPLVDRLQKIAGEMYSCDENRSDEMSRDEVYSFLEWQED